MVSGTTALNWGDGVQAVSGQDGDLALQGLSRGIWEMGEVLEARGGKESRVASEVGLPDLR